MELREDDDVTQRTEWRREINSSTPAIRDNGRKAETKTDMSIWARSDCRVVPRRTSDH